MRKNMVIALLMGVILTDVPWLAISNNGEKMAMIVGIASAVFIFLLFLEEIHEKWTEYRKRVRRISRTVKRLRSGKRERRIHEERRVLPGQAYEDARAV